MDTCNSIEIRHYYYRESVMEYIIGYWKLRARRFTTNGGSHLRALPKYCRQKQGKCVGTKNQKERWRRRLLPWTIPLHPFMSSDTPRVSWYTAVPMIFNVKWKASIRKPHFSASQQSCFYSLFFGDSGIDHCKKICGSINMFSRVFPVNWRL